MKFYFRQVVNNEIEGVVERNYMYVGHPLHQITGAIDGATFQIQTLQNLRPGNNSDGIWTYKGFVLGNTMIGVFQGKDRGGKPGSGTFRLTRN